jgi:ACR3 family arsenite efflux pump ArsB
MPIWFPHCPTWSVMISLGILFSFPLSLGQLTRVSDRKGKGKAKKTEAGILFLFLCFALARGDF